VLLRPPYAGIAAIALGKWQLREEPGGAQVEHGPALAAGLMPQVCDALRQIPCTWASGPYCGAREGRAGCCTRLTNSCNSSMFRFETTQ
jgi:hypothetical protein